MATAKALFDAESFEWSMSGSNIIGTGYVTPGFTGSWDQVSGWRGRAGRQLRYQNVTGAEVTKPGPNNPIQIGRAYFCCESFPSSGYAPIYHFHDANSGGNYCAIRLRSDGYLEAGFAYYQNWLVATSAFASSQLAPNPIGQGRWYRLDTMIDATSPTWRLHWMLSDGPATTLMPDVAWAGQTADDGFWRQGLLIDSGPGQYQPFTIVFDDWALGRVGDSGQYPIGPGRAVTVVPDHAGTHNMGSTHFQNDDGTAIDATSVARLQDLFDLSSVDGAAIGSYGDGHGVEMGNGSMSGGNYLEFYMQAYQLQADEVCHTITGAAGSYYRIAQPPMYEDVDVFTDLGELAAALPVGGSTVSNVRLGGGAFGADYGSAMSLVGGWTQTRLNNIHIRYGPYSGGSSTGFYGLSAVGFQLHLGIDHDPPNEQGPLHTWARL